MKHSTLLIPLLFVALTACNKSEMPPQVPEEGSGTIVLSVQGDFAPETKVTSDSALTDEEKTINTVQIIVFNSAGDIELRMKNSDFTVSGTTATASATLTTGAKTVWCLVNGPDVQSMTNSQLQARNIELDGYNGEGAFVQSASAACTITKNTSTPLTLKVRRYVARVTLTDVKNELESQLTITRVYTYIANYVKESYLYSGNGIGTYGNIGGKKNSQSINSANIATDPDLTAVGFDDVIQYDEALSDYGLDPFRMYTYPTPSGGTRQWLVTAAEIGGHWYYYNYQMPTLTANTAYTVEMVLKRLGADEPCVENGTGTLSVTVTPEAWTAGASTSKTF